MTTLERRIVDAVARGCREGLEPRAIYLTPDEFDELARDRVDDLPIRRLAGAGSSRVYFNSGIARALRRRRSLA